MKQMPGSSPGMTLSLAGKRKVGRRRVPKGMGWNAASNPFRAASLGGNTTLPIGLFRQLPPMIQKGQSRRRSGAPQASNHWGQYDGGPTPLQTEGMISVRERRSQRPGAELRPDCGEIVISPQL